MHLSAAGFPSELWIVLGKIAHKGLRTFFALYRSTHQQKEQATSVRNDHPPRRRQDMPFEGTCIQADF